MRSVVVGLGAFAHEAPVVGASACLDDPPELTPSCWRRHFWLRLPRRAWEELGVPASKRRVKHSAGVH
jgi:hypothetical protein